MTFIEFLIENREDSEVLGDLAREILADSQFPRGRSTRLANCIEHLEKMSPSNSPLILALEAAWELWQGQRLLTRLRRKPRPSDHATLAKTT